HLGNSGLHIFHEVAGHLHRAIQEPFQARGSLVAACRSFGDAFPDTFLDTGAHCTVTVDEGGRLRELAFGEIDLYRRIANALGNDHQAGQLANAPLPTAAAVEIESAEPSGDQPERRERGSPRSTERSCPPVVPHRGATVAGRHPGNRVLRRGLHACILRYPFMNTQAAIMSSARWSRPILQSVATF